jgi:Mg/Co/Ni transporter MgtE
VYVVDSLMSNRLLGVLTLRDLLLADPEAAVADVMETDLQVVTPNTPARTVARIIAEYNLLALPVVDEEGRLLGIVTVDDAMELMLPEGWRRRLPRVFG